MIHYPVTSAAHPTLLAVNHESRAEVLKRYSIFFGDRGFCISYDNSQDAIYIKSSLACTVSGSQIFQNGPLTMAKYGVQDNRIRKLTASTRWAIHFGTKESLEIDEIMFVPHYRKLSWVETRILGGFPDQQAGHDLRQLLREASQESGKSSYDEPVVRVVEPASFEAKEDPFCVHLKRDVKVAITLKDALGT
ncbi:uncharacterized protein LY89DRAFT_724031 [Mollisia scopiformis]|uniref:Uncharacterized protein n=1 Tax=Mollisia scopiformis TaxID=149040 RepID=A0A132BCL1_MOLSC|nr:uncharacterized protein LY89DRAFT_724031 [Mollisia scopiformis]KUJ09594.1 hypothetical protein LY89DRAFT_724031 [Mollisia scopiformis]